MTCPSCSRSSRDFTNSSGLVARCDAPYHAAADLCGTPNAHHPGCPVFRNLACDCGAAKALPDASKDSHSWQPPTPERIDALRIAESLANARPLEPAQNGFRWCHDCESVQPAAGHECGAYDSESEAWLAVFVERDRREFAESLLCATALQHGFERMDAYDLTPEDLARQRANPAWDGWVWAPCDVGECPFCDAARGGGR